LPQLRRQKNLLFLMVQKMASPKAALHPDVLSNHDMGYVFEELIRRFNEQSNENPGEHFTPREVVRLMVRLVLNGDKDLISQPGVMRTIYDPACGTGGMLSVAKTYITEHINPDADIWLFGQEVNPETYAICKSDMLIKGDDRDANNVKMGSTLSEDGHTQGKFDYMISNPPYGKDWNKDAAAVNRDNKDGRIGIVGYEINFNRYFYKYEPPRPLEEIDADIKTLEAEILAMLGEVTA